MSHGHHGGRHYHHSEYHDHGVNHYGYDRRWHKQERWIGWPLLAGLLAGLLGAFWSSGYYSRPRHGESGCSIFALLFGIIIVVTFLRFWWFLIPLSILALIWIGFLLSLL